MLTHSYLFGWVGSLFAPIVNWLLRNVLVKWVAEAVFKIDRRRQLPGYESPTFRQWFGNHHSKGDKKIAYFYGCYVNTNEVDVGKATVQVLEVNRFQVTLPPQKCCGIPMLGNGDFDGAREMGLWKVPSFLQTIRSGSDILFSSTSCGHMIKHEYSRLLNIPGSEEVAPGTENVPYVVALGAACRLARERLPGAAAHLRSLRDRLHELLKAGFPDLIINGPEKERLPNTLNVPFPGIPGGELMAGLPDLAASLGSACHAGQEAISPVLAAMGVPLGVARGAVRFSVGYPTTRSEVDRAASLLLERLGRLRG